MAKKVFCIISSLEDMDDFVNILTSEIWETKLRIFKYSDRQRERFRTKTHKDIWLIRGTKLWAGECENLNQFFESIKLGTEIKEEAISTFERFLEEILKLDKKEVDLRIFIHWGANKSVNSYDVMSKELREVMFKTRFKQCYVESFSTQDKIFYSRLKNNGYDELEEFLEYESLVPGIDRFLKKILIDAACKKEKAVDISKKNQRLLYEQLEREWDSSKEHAFSIKLSIDRLREALNHQWFNTLQCNNSSFAHPDKVKLREELNRLLAEMSKKVASTTS